MVKKAITLIFVGYLISIVQSCCTNELNCIWTDFNIQVIDNSGKEPIIWNGYKNINKKALGFRISMTDEFLYSAQLNMVTECCATSCGKNYTRLHTITSIVVKTMYDYSEKFPENSEITSLFVARNAEEIKEDYTTIDDIISYINKSKSIKYSEITYRHGTENFDLYLMDDTCVGGQQKFEISIFLSDGTIFVKQTDDLLLN